MSDTQNTIAASSLARSIALPSVPHLANVMGLAVSAEADAVVYDSDQPGPERNGDLLANEQSYSSSGSFVFEDAHSGTSPDQTATSIIEEFLGTPLPRANGTQNYHPESEHAPEPDREGQVSQVGQPEPSQNGNNVMEPATKPSPPDSIQDAQTLRINALENTIAELTSSLSTMKEMISQFSAISPLPQMTPNTGEFDELMAHMPGQSHVSQDMGIGTQSSTVPPTLTRPSHVTVRRVHPALMDIQAASDAQEHAEMQAQRTRSVAAEAARERGKKILAARRSREQSVTPQPYTTSTAGADVEHEKRASNRQNGPEPACRRPVPPHIAPRAARAAGSAYALKYGPETSDADTIDSEDDSRFVVTDSGMGTITRHALDEQIDIIGRRQRRTRQAQERDDQLPSSTCTSMRQNDGTAIPPEPGGHNAIEIASHNIVESILDVVEERVVNGNGTMSSSHPEPITGTPTSTHEPHSNLPQPPSEESWMLEVILPTTQKVQEACNKTTTMGEVATSLSNKCRIESTRMVFHHVGPSGVGDIIAHDQVLSMDLNIMICPTVQLSLLNVQNQSSGVFSAEGVTPIEPHPIRAAAAEENSTLKSIEQSIMSTKPRSVDLSPMGLAQLAQLCESTEPLVRFTKHILPVLEYYAQELRDIQNGITHMTTVHAEARRATNFCDVDITVDNLMQLCGPDGSAHDGVF